MQRIATYTRGGLVALSTLLLAAACSDEQPTASRAAAGAPSGDVQLALTTVNLRLMVDTITKGIIANGTGAYDVPTVTNTNHFRAAVDSILAGRVAGADQLLDQYGYDVYSIRESLNLDSVVVIRERIPAGQTKVPRGWGTYVFNPSAAARRVDVHVNHPIDDLNTEDMGADLWRRARGRWLMIAGARRVANADSSSDMARATGSVFNQMHQRVAAANVRTLSIHGFRRSGHPNLPAGVDQVMSNGRSTASATPTYLPADTTARRRVRNGGFIAGLFSFDAGYNELGATVNPQGHHSNNSFGFGRWMHIENDSTVRADSTQWQSLNTILRQWIIDFPA